MSQKNVFRIDGCTKQHQSSLHGSTTLYIASIKTTNNNTTPATQSANVLLLVQSISLKDGTVDCLFDNCVTCSLITESVANCLNLVGEPLNGNHNSDWYCELRFSLVQYPSF